VETNALFASDDELAILSRINACQRPSMIASWTFTNPLQRAMKTCAEQMRRVSKRLLPRPILIATYIDRDGPFLIEYRPVFISAEDVHAAHYCDADIKWDGKSEFYPGSQKAKAIALVRSKAFVRTAEFQAVGISRQYLSLLCKRGYVERAGFAKYRAPSIIRKPCRGKADNPRANKGERLSTSGQSKGNGCS